MKRTVWAGLVLAVCVVGPALSASAATIDQPRRQVRSERMERLREHVRERSLQRRERIAAAREQHVRQRERVREQRIERAARERVRRIVRSERLRVRQELRRVFRGMWR